MSQSQYFRSPTYGNGLSLEEVLCIIEKRIENRPHGEFTIAVGSDSQNTKKKTRYTTTIVLHEIGRGGIFFYKSHKIDKNMNIAARLLEESRLSIDIGRDIISMFEDHYLKDIFTLSDFNLKLEIHCDYGENGKSNTVLRDAIGWITASFIGEGIEVKSKPHAYAASCIADHYVKSKE